MMKKENMSEIETTGYQSSKYKGIRIHVQFLTTAMLIFGISKYPSRSNNHCYISFTEYFKEHRIQQKKLLSDLSKMRTCLQLPCVNGHVYKIKSKTLKYCKSELLTCKVAEICKHITTLTHSAKACFTTIHLESIFIKVKTLHLPILRLHGQRH